MSAYGTAFVADVAPGSSFDPSQTLRAAVVHGFRAAAPDGWDRLSVLLSEVELVDDLLATLSAAGRGRIAVAEDNDEFGARWVVARTEGGSVEVVHRRYILNADPDDDDEIAAAVEDLGHDPRLDDVAGPAAAGNAAATFGVAPDAVVNAEAESASAWEEIGVVGGPFPWWDALELPWPAPATGKPTRW